MLRTYNSNKSLHYAKHVLGIVLITTNFNNKKMYKSFKLNKRITISFEKFRKSIKKLMHAPISYHTGIHKHTDTINGINFYSLTVYVFRLSVIVESKHKCGHCASS